MATAGEPLSIKWNRKRGIFRYRFKADGSVTAPTVIYLPEERFGPAAKIIFNVSTAPARSEYRPKEQRLLIFNDGKSGDVEIVVSVSKHP
jgi:hypothetical protein